jgi:hypothetical protein
VSGYQIGFGFAGVLLGALIGVLGKGVFDHWNNRKNRLLDEKLKQAIAFVSAADKFRRMTQERMVDAMTLQATGLDPDLRKRTEEDHERRTLGAREALAQAEDAYNALRFLLPPVESYARLYLDLCINADPYPDTGRAKRDRARKTVESEIQRLVGA